MADYPIRIVGGNWFRLIQPLEKIEWQDSEQTVTDYEPSPNDDIKVTLIGSYSKCEMKMSNPKIVDGNKLQYENNGTVALGVYGVEVKIVCASGARLRSYQDNIVKIVKTNKEASIPDYKEFGIDTYLIDGAVFLYIPGGEGGGGGGDMSNYWTKDEADGRYLRTETDPTVPSWAKQQYKPTYNASEVHALPDTTVIPTIPTNVSSFTNDVGYLTSQSLTDYATKTWVTDQITQSGGFDPSLYYDKDDIDEMDLVSSSDLATYALKSELFSGSYLDLTNKPTLFSGSYNDLTDKPTIPSVSDKADKVQSATNGHLAGLNSSGNLIDIGYAIWVGTESDYNDILSPDNNTLYFINEATT